MHITPEQASAGVTAFALALLTLLIAFNVGRASVLAQARKCPTPVPSWTIPFKGTLP
jgi:hypothetical protein